MSDQLRPTQNLLYPEWQPLLQAAVLEFDLKKLPERIQTAEAAIARRLQTIFLDPNHHSERIALSDAVATLNLLKREYASRPGSQQSTAE